MPVGYSKGFLCVDYVLLIILRDVLYPGGNQHSLDTMCGEPYDKCTKESFMAYLGVSNPAVPFPIYIHFPDNTSEETSYYNQTTFVCTEPVVSKYENQPACGCLVSEFEPIDFE